VRRGKGSEGGAITHPIPTRGPGGGSELRGGAGVSARGGGGGAGFVDGNFGRNFRRGISPPSNTPTAPPRPGARGRGLACPTAARIAAWTSPTRARRWTQCPTAPRPSAIVTQCTSESRSQLALMSVSNTLISRTVAFFSRVCSTVSADTAREEVGSFVGSRERLSDTCPPAVGALRAPLRRRLRRRRRGGAGAGAHLHHAREAVRAPRAPRGEKRLGVVASVLDTHAAR
jgi:hypothetical protein